MKKSKINWTEVLLFIAGGILAFCCPNLAAAILVVWFIKRLFVDRPISTPKGGDSK